MTHDKKLNFAGRPLWPGEARSAVHEHGPTLQWWSLYLCWSVRCGSCAGLDTKLEFSGTHSSEHHMASHWTQPWPVLCQEPTYRPCASHSMPSWMPHDCTLEASQAQAKKPRGTGWNWKPTWKSTCLPLETNLPAMSQPGSRLEANHGTTNLQANLQTIGNQCGNHWTRNHQQATGKRSWKPLEASLAKQPLEKRLETKLETTGGQPENHWDHWKRKRNPWPPTWRPLDAYMCLPANLDTTHHPKPLEAIQKPLETKLEPTGSQPAIQKPTSAASEPQKLEIHCCYSLLQPECRQPGTTLCCTSSGTALAGCYGQGPLRRPRHRF